MNSVEFIASCLWAPPVAAQFSVLSQYIHSYIHTCISTYICKYINVSVSGSVHCVILWAPPVASQFSVVPAPTVATLVSSVHFITSFLWAPPVATLLFHLISSHHFSGHRLWRLTYIHTSGGWGKAWGMLGECLHIVGKVHICFSRCFLCICFVAILVRDMCEGAPTNPDSLCLQLEHVVDCVWSGSGQTG